MNRKSGKKTDGKSQKNQKSRDEGLKSEAKLRDMTRKEELLQTTMDSMSDGFMILETPHLVVRVFNKAAELLLDRKAGEVLEKPLFETFSEAKGSIFEEKYTRAFKKKTTEEFETYFGVEPYTAWYSVRVFPAKNSICVFFQVISDKKENEEELKAANQQLVASNQQLRAAFQQVRATEQQLRTSNQELIAANQQLAATESQLKEANEQLSRERERLDLIIRGSNDAPWDWDLETNELYFSDRYWEQLGYAPGEIPADADLWRKLAHPDDIDEVNKFLEKELKSDSSNYAKEFRLKHKDGHYIVVLSRGIISRDAAGKPVRITGSNMDLTKQRKAAEHIRNIVMNSTNMFYTHNEKQELTYISPQSQEFLGVSPEEAKTKWTEFITDHPVNRKGIQITLRAIETGKRQPPYELQLRRKDQSTLWVEVNEHPVVEEGKVVGLTGSLTDITQRRQAEIQLKISEEKFRSVLERMSLIGVMLDRNGKVKFANDYLLNLTGYSRDEVVNHDWFDLFIPEDINDEIHEIFNESMKTGDIKAVHQNEILTRSGDRLIIKWSNTLHMDEQGNPASVTSIGEDITELKLALEESIDARKKAEQSDRLKSAFLANMSHEIRTPMNGILGFANLLKKQGLNSEDQARYIDIINTSGLRMLETINNLVDISKIEAGLAELHYSRVNLYATCSELYQFFLPEAESKGLKLEFNSTTMREEFMLDTDKEKLTSIVTNLIKNAIKFTHRGAISFGYSIEKDKSGEFLEFFVKDTGVGIPENMVDKVFDRFTQIERETKKVYEGSGLGLSISKSYVEMLGGSIHVESTYGKGTNFSFKIPIIPRDNRKNEKSEVRRKSYSDKWLNDATILIAEDEEVSDQLLTELLEPHCKKILHAKTGREVVDVMKRQDGISVILMDIRMPDMDGYEATRKIREFDEEVIIIAQTAFAITGDRQKAFDAGCDEHVTKPVNENELLIKINDQHERRFHHR